MSGEERVALASAVLGEKGNREGPHGKRDAACASQDVPRGRARGCW